MNADWMTDQPLLHSRMLTERVTHSLLSCKPHGHYIYIIQFMFLPILCATCSSSFESSQLLAWPWSSEGYLTVSGVIIINNIYGDYCILIKVLSLLLPLKCICLLLLSPLIMRSLPTFSKVGRREYFFTGL